MGGEETRVLRYRKSSTLSQGAGDIKDFSPLQASTLLLRNTLVALKGEP